MSTITCNEEVKGNANCKNFHFEPPFGERRGNAQGSSIWLVGKRVVDFLLVLIELFRHRSRLRHYERIFVEIVVFERGWVNLSANFRGSRRHRKDRQTHTMAASTALA